MHQLPPLAALATRIAQFVCGLRGHDEVLGFERGRLYLECTSCGHQTPGWLVTGDAAATSEPRDDVTAYGIRDGSERTVRSARERVLAL